MTAQIRDRLILDGEESELASLPLDALVSRVATPDKPKFQTLSTANWRGYVATWQIDDDRLYLAKLDGIVVDEKAGARSARFSDVGLSGDGPHFASWYTGELRVLHGEWLSMVYAGFASVPERETIFNVEQGVVTDRIHLDNRETGMGVRLVNRNGRSVKKLRSGKIKVMGIRLAEMRDPDDVPEPPPAREWGIEDWVKSSARWIRSHDHMTVRLTDDPSKVDFTVTKHRHPCTDWWGDKSWRTIPHFEITVLNTWLDDVRRRGLDGLRHTMGDRITQDTIMVLHAVAVPGPCDVELYAAVWAGRGRGFGVNVRRGYIAKVDQRMGSGFVKTHFFHADTPERAVGGLRRRIAVARNRRSPAA